MGIIEDAVKSAKDWYKSKSYWAAILFLINQILKGKGIDIDSGEVVNSAFSTAEGIATAAEGGILSVKSTITSVLDGLTGFLAMIGIRDAINANIKSFFSIGGQGGKDPK